ncbi:YecA family protein, partial [Escherichia coli]|nr:YecA family protein [Escherichia coli]HAV8537184.1 YecA family protein [Escherichia coli]
MKLTKSGPLTDREIDWLEEILMKYGMDDSVLCFSELDGLLTAILSG